MPEWLLPALAALGGGSGLAAVLTAVLARKGKAFDEMAALVEAIKADRNDARAAATELRVAGEYATGQLYAERKYTAKLEEWAARGAPPPPPTREESLAPAN